MTKMAIFNSNRARKLSLSATPALLILASLASGCAVTADDASSSAEDTRVTEDKFIAWPGAESYLVANVISGSSIKVCLTGTNVTTANRPTQETNIRTAIVAWVDAIRPVSKVALISGSAVSFTCTSPTVSINWDAGSGRAHAGKGGIQLYNGDGYTTVLHEFGHVFGMGDTYVEGVWSCMPGQENSLMCGSGGIPNTLQHDDMVGIQEVFCLAYDNQCLRHWSSPSLGFCAGNPVLTGDFNGDGRADVLCRSNTGYNWIGHADANGHLVGTTWEGMSGFCGQATGKVIVADFNGDKHDDLLCHDTSSGDNWIAYATASGGFTTQAWHGMNGFCAMAGGQVIPGDFNGDGKKDLLCHDDVSGNNWIAYASASGTFSTQAWWGMNGFCANSPGGVRVADFNGDGRADILCTDHVSGIKFIAYATTSGTFTTQAWQGLQGFCTGPTDQLRVGDFNGDGRADLYCAGVGQAGVAQGRWVANADGAGTFPGVSRTYTTGWCTSAGDAILVGDFNNDKTTDLLCQSAPGGEFIAYQAK